MKTILAVIMMATTTIAIAGPEPTVLMSEVKTVGYLASASPNALVPGEAWEGEKLVRLEPGKCEKIVHSNLHFVPVGDAEKPLFDEARTIVTCPT
ncbi:MULTISPECIES: hypothetical protein [Burkholderia]|uniref:DUF1496 domain-containing protein n=2 Tax=Burkholderia cepacia complex TaxID=87882 RepID=A0AAP1V566_9BURK|nr:MULTISPECIES: hypothetical protein [Burkholderia]MBK1901977.1 hypothetical protein [Burkholderia contaminans]MBK1910260.1 hypothetical protein [Burkholderia contaminans]MBK1923719.1 hypothetical protein [Burkholderia contaminans]MBK1931931.1 hypothetical protein [Burkholderia contaminans]MBK1939180.1 hypothetical protein [Burkholderia contaminans]